eukprot:11410525-Ditylum_brightwellii.AAC.1
MTVLTSTSHISHKQLIAALMERSKQSKHGVCNQDDDCDNDVDNGDDNSVVNGDDDGVGNGSEGVDKHLTHLSEADDCWLIKRKKQNKLVVCNKDNDVDNGIDNGDDDSADDGDEDGVGNGNEAADKHLTHLSQANECCLMERSKQNKHGVCNKDNDGDNDGYKDDDCGDDDS